MHVSAVYVSYSISAWFYVYTLTYQAPVLFLAQRHYMVIACYRQVLRSTPKQIECGEVHVPTR